MWAGLVVLGLLILLILFVIFAIDSSGKAKFDLGVFFGIIISILLAGEIVLLSSILEDPKPTAIDVYRGKTTLEYTIRDSVKIDSVVVFKDSLIIN
jgi:hypothetical protein